MGINNRDLINSTFDFVIYLLVINLVFSVLFGIINLNFRTILAIESLICIVAGIVYYLIINIYRKTSNMTLADWDKITTLRYIDWSITTPLLLTSFSLFLASGEKVKNLGNFIVSVVFFDLIMILAGFLGAKNVINDVLAQIVGFGAYFMIFFLMYNKFFREVTLSVNILFKQVFFYMMIFLWFIYGVIYNFSIVNRNIITNVLDGLAKGLFGLTLSIYLLLKIVK
jgi:bacteriorhodopsin